MATIPCFLSQGARTLFLLSVTFTDALCSRFAVCPASKSQSPSLLPCLVEALLKISRPSIHQHTMSGRIETPLVKAYFVAAHFQTDAIAKPANH